jgi:hypothetical protein
MTYVARERIELEIKGFVGDPTELTIEVIFEDNPPQIYVFGTNPEIVKQPSGAYTYQFVPNDSQGGVWKYRWYGKDSRGIEFARPSDERYKTLNVY